MAESNPPLKEDQNNNYESNKQHRGKILAATLALQCWISDNCKPYNPARTIAKVQTGL